MLCVCRAQGGARSGSEALSSAVLNIEKGKMEREVQAQVSVILSSAPSSKCLEVLPVWSLIPDAHVGFQLKELQGQLQEERNCTELAEAELHRLKTENERQKQREAGVKAADGVYLKNIVLGYVTNSGDRTRLLPVLAELLQFSDEDVAKIKARSASWLPDAARKSFW